MIASQIGRKFLNEYNKRMNTQKSAKDFFTDIYFPLFYNHPKYMQWITNSPFVQGLKKGVTPTENQRKEKLNTLLGKIENNEIDASTAIGFGSSDILATTSGQITNIDLPIPQEEIYCSWLGGALGIGVQGGFSILFDDVEILWNLFEGWEKYRAYLEETPQLRANQINTWNGQWVTSAFDGQNDFNPFDKDNSGGMEIRTQSWTKVVFALSKKFPDATLTGYVYNLGQTNTTIGFIPFKLPQVSRLSGLYKKLFGENAYLSDRTRIEQFYGTSFSFLKACESGSIGIVALEPKAVHDALPGRNAKLPVYKSGDEDSRISFNVYKTWLLAMLNNEELMKMATEAANTFLAYEAGATKGKKDRSNNIRTVLDASGRRQFIENLIPVISEAEQKDRTALHGIVNEANKMPVDNFPYFLTLIKFQYAFLKN